MTTAAAAGAAAPAAPAPAAGAGAGAPAVGPGAGADSPAGAPAGDTGSGPAGGADGGDGGDGTATGRGGAGRETGQATGFAQGALRHDTVRHARASIDGDLVAGDKNVFLVGGGRQPLRLVSPLVLERVRGAFEEPEQWARTRREFGGRSLVILRGNAGTGKTTAALRLLLGSAVSQIYHLDRNTDLGALAARLDTAGEEGAEGSTGYLVDQPVDAAALRGWLVQGLEGVLHRAGARLVLTVDQEAGLVDPDLLDYVIELTGPPRHHGIVRRYLEWRLGEPAAGQVLGLQEVADILEERLAGEATCKVAADLASAVWEAAEASGSGIPDVTRIRAKLARRGAEDFDMWVESLDDPFLRCYAVALAVLNGLPQEDVASAARSLHRRLNSDRHTVLARDDGRLPRLREPYEVPRRRRLAQLRAHAVPVTFFSPNGSVPAEGLVYKDPGYARRVIRHAWTEYPMQGELLDWLGELADDPSEQVRTHAGVALGVLADSSFQYLAAHVFHPWAAGTSRTRRNAVANALSVTAENPRLRSMVTALAAGWIADPDRPMALATAARVHGVSLSGAEPLAAVDALVRLAVVDHVQVAVAIGDSLTDILAEEESLTAVVLNRLWTAMADHRARPTVLLSFLAVAAQLVVETAGLDLGAAAPNWPALLVSVEREAALRPPFVALWRTALNEAVYRGEAEHVLRVWAALAEADPALRELFLRFVTATAHGDPRTGTVLRRQAADWVAPQTLVPLPRTSAAVTAELDRLETAR